MEQRISVSNSSGTGNFVEKYIEVPVEKIVQKIVEVPVEKFIEKIVEVPSPNSKAEPDETVYNYICLAALNYLYFYHIII